MTTTLNLDHDKWSAERFQPQRDELIDLIAREGIEQLVFLTGDMHCCYHASMRIGQASKYECVTIHELCAGPVNQLQLGSITDFETRFTGRTLTDKTEYEVTLDQFHGEVNGVMHLSVNYMQPDRFLRRDQPKTPEITWNVIRTLTDDGATAWSGVPPGVPNPPDAGAVPPPATSPATSRATPLADTPPSEWQPAEPTMAGRITFVRKRTTEELALWP